MKLDAFLTLDAVLRGGTLAAAAAEMDLTPSAVSSRGSGRRRLSSKALWAFSDDRIAVRFQYEWHDAEGQWWRSYGNENWEFDVHGLMSRREASINDVPIAESARLFRWPLGPRPAEHPGLSQLGL